MSLLTLPPELLAKVVAHLGSAALFADPARALSELSQVSAARRAAKALSHTAQTSKLLKEVVDTDDSWKGLYMHYLEKRLREEVRQLLTNLIADKEAPILGKHPTLKQWLDELDDGKYQHKEIRAKVTQLFPVGKGAERVAKAQVCRAGAITFSPPVPLAMTTEGAWDGVSGLEVHQSRRPEGLGLGDERQSARARRESVLGRTCCRLSVV
eukprot:scaffold42320_cov73-Phaeocystis_antarctica.AAC.2